MGNAERWASLLRPSPRDDQEAEEVKGQAQAFLQWRKQPYYDRHMQWLQDQANTPVKPGDHMDMLVGATRSNTIREVLEHLRQLENRAHMALGDENV